MEIVRKINDNDNEKQIIIFFIDSDKTIHNSHALILAIMGKPGQCILHLRVWFLSNNQN